jgi:hypothetical protein
VMLVTVGVIPWLCHSTSLGYIISKFLVRCDCFCLHMVPLLLILILILFITGASLLCDLQRESEGICYKGH